MSHVFWESAHRVTGHIKFNKQSIDYASCNVLEMSCSTFEPVATQNGTSAQSAQGNVVKWDHCYYNLFEW